MINEFKGATLAEAVRNATAAYGPRGRCEVKNQRRCNDLILEVSSLKNAIGRASDDAERLADDADQLRRSASVELALSALAAIGTFARALRAFKSAWRRLENRDVSRLSKREIIDLLSILGPIGATAGALYAIDQLREAGRLARRAETIEKNAERFGEELLNAVSEYNRIGCGRSRNITS